MKLFANILRFLSIINIVCCLLLLILYLFFSEQFAPGQALEAVAYLACFEAFFLTLPLSAIFAASSARKGQARLHKVNVLQLFVYVLSSLLFVCLSLKESVMNSNFSATQAIIPIFLTLAIMMNNQTDIMASSWLFHRSPTEYVPGIFAAGNGNAKLASGTPEGTIVDYLDYIPERVAYLKNYSRVDLDYSDKSLLRLWKWFRRQCKADFSASAPLGESVRFTTETESILHDISLYFAKVFLEKNDSISWSVCEDTGGIMLFGFSNGQTLYPSRAVREVASYILKEIDTPRDLLDMFFQWQRS